MASGDRPRGVRPRERRRCAGRVSAARPPRGDSSGARIGARRGVCPPRGGRARSGGCAARELVGARRKGCRDGGQMASTLTATFDRLRREQRPGLVTYTTAADPDVSRSAEILKALGRGGADVIEVGVPCSDPLADGPVIQRATERALAAGGNLRTSLRIIAEVRPHISAPIVVFSYANPLLRLGTKEFARQAAAAGVDGVLT